MANNRRVLTTTALMVMVIMTLIVSAVPVFGQDSLDMSRLGRLQEWWSYPIDVVMDGNYAYLLTEAPGIIVYDLANPHAPRIVTQVNANGYWGGMTLNGNRLLTTGLSGRFLDVSNPEAPISLSPTPRIWGMGKPAMWGDYIYAPVDGGFYVWDVTDPSDPVRGVSYSDNNSFGSNTELVAINGFLFLGDHFASGVGYRRSIRIFDLIDPAHPALLPDSIAGRFISDFEIEGTYLYLCGVVNSLDGVHVFDLTTPDHPEFVTSVPQSDAIQVVADGERLVVATTDALYFYDVADPSNPVLLGSQPSSYWGYARGLDVEDALLFRAVNANLSVVNIADLGNPEVIFEQEVHLLDEILGFRPPYVIATTSGSWDNNSLVKNLEIIEVSDERNPRRAGMIHVEGYPKLFANDLLFSVKEDSVLLYGTDNLLEPQRVSDIFVTGASLYSQLAEADQYLYILHEGQLNIFDVIEPSSPSFVSSTAIDMDHRWMLVEFPLAVVWDYWESTLIFDVSEPEEPNLVGEFPLLIAPQESLGVAALQNSIVYQANYYGDSRIVDLRNPAFPVQYPCAWLDRARSIVGSDEDYLYISTGYYPEPIVILDIHTDPLNPQPVGYYPTYARSAIRNDDRLYVCDDYSFQILSLFGHYSADDSRTPFITSFSLHPAYPNPFNYTTTISFDLPRAQPVVYEIVNTLGQQVMRTDLGNVPSGVHRVSLNATGWSSGNYWVKVQAGANIKSTRIVLLK